MIAIGPIEPLLLLALLLLITVSLIWRQLLAPWILLAGALLLGYLALSVRFGITFPYLTFNISIYIFFFIAVMLIVAGGIGSAVRLYRYFLGGN